MASDGMANRLNRRRFSAITAMGSAGIVAGCLGDDADDAEAIDDQDDADDTVVPDDSSDDDVVDDGDDIVADDEDDDDEPDVQIQEVLDVTATWHTLPEHPADLQWNQMGGEAPFWSGISDPHHQLMRLSWADLEYHPLMVEDVDYQPGLLEFSIHDDFYWWSGDNVTIDDIINQIELVNYVQGGDGLDAHDTFVTYQKTGDHALRLSLADTWHERWAIRQTVGYHQEIGTYPDASRAFTGPWLDRFEDAPDLDAVEELREEFDDEDHTTDEELVHNFYSPYEFRFDGSIGEIGSDYIIFELVQEKNGNVRHTANLANSDRWPNFRYIRAEVVEETDVWETEAFMNQERPWAGWDEELEQNVDFDVDLIQFYRPPNVPLGFQFNQAVHPSDDLHFRRAWAYLTDNTAWEDFTRIPVTSAHGFLSDMELETFVSQDVIDAFTDYGWNEMRFDDAEAELLAGGYERNGDGNWLLQDDSLFGDAGEPMDFEMDIFDFNLFIEDEATDFWMDLEDFGIQTEIIPDTGTAWGAHSDYVVTGQYTGGESPEYTFHSIFVDPPASRNAYNIPSTILAPEIGATSGVAPSTDDWIEYDVEAMATRLAVTTEAEAYQALTDSLAWAVNQTVPHFSAAVNVNTYLMNDDQWNFIDPDAYPEKAVRTPFRLIWRGSFQATS